MIKLKEDEIKKFRADYIGKKRQIKKIEDNYTKIMDFSNIIIWIILALIIISFFYFQEYTKYLLLISFLIVFSWFYICYKIEKESREIKISVEEEIKFHISDIIIPLKKYLSSPDNKEIEMSIQKMTQLQEFLDDILLKQEPIFHDDFKINQCINRLKSVIVFYNKNIQKTQNLDLIEKYLTKFKKIYDYLDTDDYNRLSNYLETDYNKTKNQIK